MPVIHLKNFIIKVTLIEIKIKENKALTWKFGTVNPTKERPLNVNATIEIDVTKTVSKYKMTALTIKENQPKVIIVRGSVRRVKTGFTAKNKIDRVMPPRTYVAGPPDIFNPDII